MQVTASEQWVTEIEVLLGERVKVRNTVFIEAKISRSQNYRQLSFIVLFLKQGAHKWRLQKTTSANCHRLHNK